ncbi:MAG: hypothetical protein ACHQ0J_13810 [Candidatus Dormibacterales bacterium]
MPLCLTTAHDDLPDAVAVISWAGGFDPLGGRDPGGDGGGGIVVLGSLDDGGG